MDQRLIFRVNKLDNKYDNKKYKSLAINKFFLKNVSTVDWDLWYLMKDSKEDIVRRWTNKMQGGFWIFFWESEISIS